jgi:hypothetical protein
VYFSEPDSGAHNEQFIEWLAIPPGRRDPATFQLMADALGVTVRTLHNWKNDPRIKSKVKGRINTVLTVDSLAEIVDTLKEQAFDAANPRSVQASKLLIDMMQRGEDDAVEVPLSDKSLDELKDLVAGLYDELDEREDAKSA